MLSPWPRANNYFVFTQDVTGNVGIDKKPTLGKLDIAGDIYANGRIVLASDEHLKTNVFD